jgi:acid phosphatase
VAVFENKSYQQIVQSSQAPWLHELMGSGAVYTDSHGVTHPSQPNYLAMFSGSTQGVSDDHCPVRLGNQPNLARQLFDAGLGFAGYSEDLPGPGSHACGAAGYAAKHNPWVDFDNVPATANQPYANFPATFASLPTVSFVVPNLCHDMHDCSVATGDAWARDHLDGYRRWAAVVSGAGIAAQPYPQRIDHYSVLRAIEYCYGLAPLGAAASAPVMPGVCRS